MDEEESNYDWMQRAIYTAMTEERLDMLCHDIVVDKEGGVDYTTDATQLDKLREMVREKYRWFKQERERKQRESACNG